MRTTTTTTQRTQSQSNHVAGVEESRNKPVHRVKMGLVEAAIWENRSQDGVWHSVRFQRAYKDAETWKSTDSFGRDDLLLLAKAADHAHTWIQEQRQKSVQAGL